jgi:serine/threonine-protein kinase
MDWDDEEESTHVYDKATHELPPKGPLPAAGTPPPAKVGAAAALLASSGGAAAPAKLPAPLPPPVAPPVAGSSTAPASAAPTEPAAPSPTVSEAPAAAAAPAPSFAPAKPSYRADETVLRTPPPAAPAPGAGRAGVVLGGLALVVVLALAVFIFLPKNGALKIDIKAKSGTAISKAEIFVDGQKKCDTAPCVVTDLPPGPKTIKVLSSEFAPPDPVTETVEANKERLVFITVDSAGGAGLKVASVVPGVRIFVDGVDRGVLPVDLKDVAPGAHKVRFEAGDRYEKLEQNIEVPASGAKDLGAVKLKVIKGQVTVDLATKGAIVTLVGKRVQKKLPDGPWPIKLDLEAADGWRLVAAKKGFQDFSQELSFDDGRAEKSVTITLAEEGATEPAAAASGTPSATPSATPAVAPGPAPTPAPGPVAAKPTEKPAEKPAPTPSAEPAEKPAPAANAGTGTLNMNSIPVSKVVLDGRPMGSTPKVGQSVPAGSHTVVFIHPELGKKSVTVVVKAGETKTAAVKFK